MRRALHQSGYPDGGPRAGDARRRGPPPTGIGSRYPHGADPVVATAIEIFHEHPDRVKALTAKAFQARLRGYVNTAAAAYTKHIGVEAG